MPTTPTTPTTRTTPATPATPRLYMPHRAWYPVAASEEVGRRPIGRRLLDVPVALYRTPDGTAVALHDRCAHRPVRLSAGRVEGDTIVAPYTGFAYGPSGRCVSVPTQAEVPYGAAVRSFPVHDDGSFVWVWPGERGISALRRPPSTDHLRAEEWYTFGGELEVRAGLGLLHDNFCDITHVAQLDPEIAPPALRHSPTPALEVEVSETTVRFRRQFPAADLAPWHAQVLDLPEDSRHEQVEEGEFVSPGWWVDRWTVQVNSHGARNEHRTFVFSHALTPVTATRTRHLWRVSRNFASSASAVGTLQPLFESYYVRVADALEEMQHILDQEGSTPEVAVAADAAVSHVRRIIQGMVDEESPR